MERYAYIGVPAGTQTHAIMTASIAIDGLFGEQPKVKPLPSCAGPNDTVQFLFSPQFWLGVGVGFGVLGRLAKPYYDQIMKRLADLHFDAFVNKSPPSADEARYPIEMLCQAVSQAKTEGNMVLFGFMYGGARNIGVEIVDTSDEAIGRVVAALGLHGEELLSDLAKYKAIDPASEISWQQEDMSHQILVDPEVGALKIRLVYRPDGGERCQEIELSYPPVAGAAVPPRS